MLAKILAPVFTLSGWFWTVAPYVLIAFGLFFTIRTKGVQFKMVGESIHLLMEKNEGEGISAFGAFCVSTASRVGTGNVIGVATAIATGGPGAIFWMWVTALIGGASAFVESTLAQIYKKKADDGSCYGGPAYYIEAALHSRALAIIFAVSLIFCYGVAFNMLASYNLQSVFEGYSFYNESSPYIIGGIVSVFALYILIGGGKRIVKAMDKMVPVMGIFYTLVALICIIINIGKLPAMFALIFKDAFDFKAIFGGFAGSCMMLGFKRGLYSNEAGIGSAPNAAAAADCSHPAKQGLVQMLSVYVDTLILCTATGLLCVSSGINPIADGSGLSGAAYAKAAAAATLGGVGPTIIVIALVLFAFSTLCGNFYFIENCIAYLNKGKMPTKTNLTIIRVVGVAIIFVGATLSAGTVWDLADFFNILMAYINLPVCAIIGTVAYKCLDNYIAQRKEGKNPKFKAVDIGMNDKLDYWN